MTGYDPRRESKAQSAMEYLITYGWAILILGVVLAALYALGVLNPGTYSTQECVLSSGFACLSYTMNSMGVLTLNLQQSTPDPVSVYAIYCGQNTIPSGQQPNPLSIPVSLPVGANAILPALPCYTSSGANFQGGVGSVYSGVITLNYTDKLTGLPGIAVGKIVVKVSAI